MTLAAGLSATEKTDAHEEDELQAAEEVRGLSCPSLSHLRRACAPFLAFPNGQLLGAAFHALQFPSITHLEAHTKPDQGNNPGILQRAWCSCLLQSYVVRIAHYCFFHSSFSSAFSH